MFNLLMDETADQLGMQPKDLEELLDAVGVSNKQLAASSESVKGIIAERKQAQDEVITAMQTQGKNSLVVQQAEELAALKAQNQATKVATTLGTNMNDSAEILTKISAEWKTATQDAIDKRQKLGKAMDVKFTDDPLGYLAAQFLLPSLSREADAATTRRNDAASALNEAQVATQQLPKTTAATAEARSDATVQATLEQAAAKINQGVATAKIQNSVWNLQGIESLNKISLEQVNLQHTAFASKMQEANLQIARENLDESKKTRELHFADISARMEDRKANQAELNEMATTMKIGLASMGFPGAMGLPTSKLMQMAKMPMYASALEVGIYTEATGANSDKITQVLGITPAEVAKNIVLSKAPMSTIQQGSVRPLFQNTWDEIADPKNAIKFGLDEKAKPEQVMKVIGKEITKRAQFQLSDIKPGDNSNIYAAPSLDVIAAVPAVQSSTFFQKVLAPQVAAGGLKEINPDQLMTLATKAIRDKTISFEDARVGLQGMFGAVRNYNNAYKNFGGLALPLQDGYRTRLSNGLSASKIYDLTRPQDIGNLLSTTLLGQDRLLQSTIKTGFFD